MAKFKYSWIVQCMDTATISHTVKHEEGTHDLRIINLRNLYEENLLYSPVLEKNMPVFRVNKQI